MGRDGAAVLVVGDDPFLVERALRARLDGLCSADPEVDVAEAQGGELEPGDLAALASPSLFGSASAVVLRAAQDVPKAVAGELARFVAEAGASASVLMSAATGAKGKAVLDAVTAAGAERVEVLKPRTAAEREAFVRRELEPGRRRVEDGAVRALLETVGADPRELAIACAQLLADTTGDVDAAVVLRYHRGRADASSFAVADRAAEGDVPAALEELRHAVANGVAPVLVVSAMGSNLRSIAKVAAARGGRPYELAKALGMPAWKVERMRRLLPGWRPEALALALTAVAEADAAVKGGGADPGYALERLVVRVAGARQVQGAARTASR